MSTFGNVSFVLKTSTVTYIVFEELSAVESSCRCDYLEQYPVTIRSVLDCPAAGASGPNSSIETCILEQIDQNSSLLADEEEGQINNFMQLLDMDNLDEYLEQDEKEKSSASDKPLLEVGNEEIIVTEDEAAQSEGEKEADVAEIEKQALQLDQLQQKKTAGTVLVDNRAKEILKLNDNLLRLTDLPQLMVAVQRVPNKVKIRPKKGSLPSKHGALKKKKIAVTDSSVSKKVSEASSDHVKKQQEPDNCKARKTEPSVEKKKTNKETCGGKEVAKSGVKSDKEKSKKKHTKKQNPVPITEQTQMKAAESTISENKIETKREACETKSSDKKKDGENEANANIAEHKHNQGKTQKERKISQENEKVKANDSKTEISESTTENTIANKEEKETNIQQKSELLQSKKSVFVQLTKLTLKQIQELSQIRRKTVTSHSVVDSDIPNKVKEYGEKSVVNKRKPGPAKGAMKEKQVSMEKQAVKEKTNQAEKRRLSDGEMEPSASLVAKDDSKPTAATPTEKPTETESTHKKKKPKLEKASEKVKLVHPEAEKPAQKEQTISSTDEKSTPSEGSKAQNDSEQKTSEIQQSKVEEPNAKPQKAIDEPAVLPEATSEVAQLELLDKISYSVPDVSNTVEIGQIESAADLESSEDRPLVMDISFDMTDEIIDKQSLEEGNLDRKVVLLDSKSAALLKGKTHDDHLLFLDVLPRIVVKVRRVTASDYNITRSKERPKSSSGHHEKPPPKKVSFDPSAIKRKEDKQEKPRKTNLDRIDSKFLPAGSKLKSKIKSKTEINHKKHLPVPELPIELKTHLNTSFKIPKKNSNVKTQSIDRNASELNCLHKEQDERDKQRKRFQKERRPRDGPGNRDRKQNRSESSNVRQEREPSPAPDFFDPSFDDHSPSPQRIPPTPPPATETPTTAPSQPVQRDGNKRPAVKNQGSNKPSFQEIWNIPEKKPEVWAKPPWGSSAVGLTTIDSGDTWDSAPVQPHRDRNINTRPNVPRDTRDSRPPVARAPQSRNTIDSGGSWSPDGAALQNKSEQQQPSRTIDDGETWSPGTNKCVQQPQRDLRQDSHLPQQFSARRSRSPHQVQLSNTISGGDMWDLDNPASTRKLSSPKRNVHQNPLLSGETWDDDSDMFNEPTGVASSDQFDRRPSNEQRPLNTISSMRKPPERNRRSRSPFRQRRSQSRSPDRRQRSTDRSPIRRNNSADQSSNRRIVGQIRSRDQRSQSPVARQLSVDQHANRPPDRRNHESDQSPFGKRRRSRSRSPVRLQGSFNKPPLGRMPFRPGRSCSPRPDLTLSSTDMWDAGTSSRTQLPPKQNIAENLLLAGGTWDDEIVPLRGLAGRSPPRLRESLQDRRQRYALDRLSPNGRRRSISRDRLLPERTNESFDRSPLREGGNRKWSRDRSPNRRKRSHSRSPDGWRQSMERSPVRRRHSVGNRSPNYQRMLDYWKAVEDREGEMEMSSDRPNVERFNEFGHSERWVSHDILDPGDRSWSPPASDRGLAKRNITGRIDSDIPWANEPEPRHRAMDDSQYSPSRAFDAISSEDECDFTNPRRAANKTTRKSTLQARESFETIPLTLPSRSQQPIIQLDELPFATTSPIVDHEASRDSLDSVPPFKGNEDALEKPDEVSPTKKHPVGQTPSPQPQAGADEKKSVLEHLKQRAERLKKLEEMKLARQKLLVQIKQKHLASNPQSSEVDMSKLNMPMHVQPSEMFDDDIQHHPDPVPCTSNRQVLVAAVTVPTANALLSNVDSLHNKPLLPATGIPVPFPQIPTLPIGPPLSFSIAPPVPPLPSEAPPPPPPDEPQPQEPADFINTMIPPPSSAWNPHPPPFTPMAHFDVSQPPPNLANPLLNTMPSPQYEPDEEEPFDDRSNSFADNNTLNPQFQPSNFFDKFRRSQPNRGQNFNMSPEDNSFRRMPSEENDFINMGMRDFNEPDNQQQNRDPRQQQQQHRFGGNRQFMRQQQQQKQQRDPRQNHDGNVYGGAQSNRNNNSNNPGNNFNSNNPGNNFNNNNPGNNFNNNPGRNFNNNNPGNNFSNNPGNNFNNNNPGKTFNNNNPGNNFSNNPGNNFNNNNPGNNFSNSPGNNFNNNNPGNNFNNNPGNNFNNNNPGNNFNNNPGNNFNNNNPGNNFNSGRGSGGRGRFNNNQQQQRFNLQQQNRNPRFNNNRNNQQQQRFLMQQQEMFDESCFDMNEVDSNDGGDANNWDDLM
ncbi:serine/arginine repetitive matrix protein 2-like isoform X2 [Ochlerotatus camptorhynchus]